MSQSIAELFIKEAIKTESCNFVEIAERLAQPKTIRLLHAALGLSTEANEFLDALKKWIFYGKELDEVNLAEELGDSDWYKAIACDELGKSFEEIQIAVIQKLRKRYSEKFNSSEALTRDLSSERNELEKKIDLASGFGMGSKKLTEAIKMEIEEDISLDFNTTHFSMGGVTTVCGQFTKNVAYYSSDPNIVNCSKCISGAKVNYDKSK